MQIIIENLNIYHNKHDLKYKYKNSFKAAAKKVRNLFIPKILIPIEYALMILEIKHNLNHLVFFSLYHGAVKSDDQLFQKLY